MQVTITQTKTQLASLSAVSFPDFVRDLTEALKKNLKVKVDGRTDTEFSVQVISLDRSFKAQLEFFADNGGIYINDLGGFSSDLTRAVRPLNRNEHDLEGDFGSKHIDMYFSNSIKFFDSAIKLMTAQREVHANVYAALDSLKKKYAK